jgi:caspase domain-containing protein
VNRTQSSPAWDLQYAANDAREMNQVMGDKLKEAKHFADVVQVRLVSDQPGSGQPNEATATKKHVQEVLDVLAGRRVVDEELKQEIPDIEKVERAAPEDLVLLAFSSHGYTDNRGVFHMVLADIGEHIPQNRVTPELDANSLSSDELSGWLREVDAGGMVMVVDACQSAATVEAEGFKPGPMGSRGLGQMAYDKGMRILAASKSEQSAVERDGIKHGLLSYALLDEGLKQGLADFQPKDGKILMSEWLAYGEQEVPKLFREGDSKGVIQVKGGSDTARDAYHGTKQTLPRYQQPVLFDFGKPENDIVVSIE